MADKKEFLVTESGELFDFLLKHYKRVKVKSLLRYRAVLLNDRLPGKHNEPVQPGDRVLVSAEKTNFTSVRLPSGMEIMYEDEAIIIVNKPAGLLTIATEKEKTRTAYYELNDYLKSRTGPAKERIFIVHRIDRETSGLIVFAKNEEVKFALQKHWESVEKKYVAVVEGVPRKPVGTIEAYLSENNEHKVYASGRTDPGAKYCITHYRIIRNNKQYALLEIELETGRKNQIRAHLEHIGHPIAGDRKYGAQTRPLLRIALHAWQLSFNHPLTGERMHIEAKLPESFHKITRR